jgi:hypothetical protein
VCAESFFLYKISKFTKYVVGWFWKFDKLMSYLVTQTSLIYLVCQWRSWEVNRKGKLMEDLWMVFCGGSGNLNIGEKPSSSSLVFQPTHVSITRWLFVSMFCF